MRGLAVAAAGTEAGRQEHGRGAGGDMTVGIDVEAEAAVLQGLGRTAAGGERFSVLSEEIGPQSFGAAWPLILVDPIDGSLNAKQGLPVYALMMTLLTGPRLGDAAAGLVLNLATGESWSAVHGEGARHNGQPLTVLDRRRGRHRFEMVALESSPRSALAARGLLEEAAKVRILGSMALSIVHTATGGIDVFAAPFKARAFDMSASLLILRELGGVATDCAGADVFALEAGLESRTSLLCSAYPDAHSDALPLVNAG